MATVTGDYGKELVKTLQEQNGHWANDPQVKWIIQYKSVSGETCWSLCWIMDEMVSAMASPYVIDPVLIFTAKVET